MMGSAISYIHHDLLDLPMAGHDPTPAPAFPHAGLLVEEQRLMVQRLIDYEKRKGPVRIEFCNRMDEEQAVARPHARKALRHYNSSRPGAELDVVKPLRAACGQLRGSGELWVHVNFLARRRDRLDAPVQRFFAELRYVYSRRNWRDVPTVEVCTELPPMEEEEEEGMNSDCAFCRRILHPGDVGFLCGKEGQLFLPVPVEGLAPLCGVFLEEMAFERFTKRADFIY